MNTSLIRFQQSFWPSQPLTPKAKNPRHRWNSIKLVKKLPEWQKAATRNPVHQGKHHAKSPIRDHWCTEESASRICAGPNAFYTAHKQPTKLVIRCLPQSNVRRWYSSRISKWINRTPWKKNKYYIKHNQCSTKDLVLNEKQIVQNNFTNTHRNLDLAIPGIDVKNHKNIMGL